MRVDGRRKTGEETLADMFHLLAYGMRRNLTRHAISTLYCLPSD